MHPPAIDLRARTTAAFHAVAAEGANAGRMRLRWRWAPVSVAEFFEAPRFLGLKRELWPTLVGLAEEIEHGGYSEVVITGSQGGGKSYLADLLQARQLYLLTCLADPHGDYGLSADTTLFMLQQSITEKLAQKVLFDHLNRLLRRSPYFRALVQFDKDITSELRFGPTRNLRLTPIASLETAALGENVIGAILDEINFRQMVADSARSVSPGESYDAATRNYHALRRRMRNRFLVRGQLPGLLLMVSSARYPDDFTEQREAEADRELRETGRSATKVIRLSAWGARPAGDYGKQRFRVAVPREPLQRARILEAEEPAPLDMDVIEPPEEFRSDFEQDLEGAIRDIGGKATRAVHPFFPRADLLAEAFKADRLSPFSHEVTTSLRAADGFVINPKAFDATTFATPRAAHLDLALKRDSAAVSVGYVAGIVPIGRTNIESERAKQAGRGSWLAETDRGLVEYAPRIVIEAVLALRAKPGDEIQLVDLATLLVHLREQIGVPIQWVTADTWQSFSSLQMLRQRNMIAGTLSVDMDPEPYEEFKSAVADQRLSIYRHMLLLREAVSLEKNEKTGRVDHPKWMTDSEGQRMRGSKDCADTVAGVCHTLARVRDHWRAQPEGMVGFGTPGRPQSMRPASRRWRG